MAVRLQPMRKFSADTTQDPELAMHVGGFDTTSLQVRVAAAADSGSYLVFQHAASLEEQAFMDVGPGVSLSKTGSVSLELTGLLEFLRIKVVISGGTAALLVDGVGRGR